MDNLFKYKAGLGVVGLFTFVLLLILLAQSGATRHDKNAYKHADKVANQLNDYTDTHDTVPSSLSDIGAQDVPDISYTKLSSQRYQFCITYKKSGNNYNASQKIVDWYYGDGDYSYEPSEDDGYLYLSQHHHKGENCQTVKIYTSDYYDDSTDYNTQSL